ncbi:tryptophanase [Mycolicibacterium sp.]|uniref:tryptophanase n=1 Tax=Mycolicibacterium sp. TaxID=2320850 RepID=UPI0037C908D3
MLADAVNAHLIGHERRMVFVELGCGEEYLAIKRILTAVLSGRMPMPVVILDTVTRWLDGYSGNPEEPPLRTVLAEIRAQQSVRVEAYPSVEQSECRPRAADGQPARLGISYA